MSEQQFCGEQNALMMSEDGKNRGHRETRVNETSTGDDCHTVIY